MKLIDALREKGRPFEIPDASRDDLPQLFIDLGFKKGVEIGVDKAEFSEKFAKVGLELYGVDPWKYDDDYKDSRSQARLDKLYEHSKRVLLPYPKCKIIRKTSVEAVKDFEDESLDFVYIDGNHQLKYVIEDLVEWTKKVKKGGVVSGHDYIRTPGRTPAGICHVIYAVNAFIGAYKIRGWFLIGRAERRENEIRDRFRSWFFIR
jgi:hypothetical protein